MVLIFDGAGNQIGSAAGPDEAFVKCFIEIYKMKKDLSLSEQEVQSYSSELLESYEFDSNDFGIENVIRAISEEEQIKEIYIVKNLYTGESIAYKTCEAANLAAEFILDQDYKISIEEYELSFSEEPSMDIFIHSSKEYYSNAKEKIRNIYSPNVSGVCIDDIVSIDKVPYCTKFKLI